MFSLSFFQVYENPETNYATTDVLPPTTSIPLTEPLPPTTTTAFPPTPEPLPTLEAPQGCKCGLEYEWKQDQRIVGGEKVEKKTDNPWQVGS